MSTYSLSTLVLALGNPLRGDDGVGLAVLNALREQSVPPTVTLLDGGTPGLETVLILREYPRVIIVDAAEMGMEPGQWVSFSPGEVRLQSRDMHLRGTLHYAGLAEALALSEALGLLPAEIVIFAVQPGHIGWEARLTPAVADAVPQVAAAIRARW